MCDEPHTIYMLFILNILSQMFAIDGRMAFLRSILLFAFINIMGVSYQIYSQTLITA